MNILSVSLFVNLSVIYRNCHTMLVTDTARLHRKLMKVKTKYWKMITQRNITYTPYYEAFQHKNTVSVFQYFKESWHPIRQQLVDWKDWSGRATTCSCQLTAVSNPSIRNWKVRNSVFRDDLFLQRPEAYTRCLGEWTQPQVSWSISDTEGFALLDWWWREVCWISYSLCHEIHQQAVKESHTGLFHGHWWWTEAELLCFIVQLRILHSHGPSMSAHFMSSRESVTNTCDETLVSTRWTTRYYVAPHPCLQQVHLLHQLLCLQLLLARWFEHNEGNKAASEPTSEVPRTPPYCRAHSVSYQWSNRQRVSLENASTDKDWRPVDKRFSAASPGSRAMSESAEWYTGRSNCICRQQQKWLGRLHSNSSLVHYALGCAVSKNWLRFGFRFRFAKNCGFRSVLVLLN